ncbi:hypothetical protein NXS19_003862 [Fusarium pseudograminearum]|nr:hypothetical protein NXS19_003862 [Fusarium pseudograminearum]
MTELRQFWICTDLGNQLRLQRASPFDDIMELYCIALRVRFPLLMEHPLHAIFFATEKPVLERVVWTQRPVFCVNQHHGSTPGTVYKEDPETRFWYQTPRCALALYYGNHIRLISGDLVL